MNYFFNNYTILLIHQTYDIFFLFQEKSCIQATKERLKTGYNDK